MNTVKKGSYLYTTSKNHPKATKTGYILQHRAVVEKHLGRFLESWEVVHHKDGNKHNNEIENLEVMSRVDHGKLHAKRGRKTLSFVCPNCGKVFSRFANQYIKGTAPKCSRKCNGEYSRKIQLGII